MSEVVWLPEALQDAQRLRLFLLDKNGAAAARAGKVLQDGAKLLGSFPEAGVPMNFSFPNSALIVIHKYSSNPSYPLGSGYPALQAGISRFERKRKVVFPANRGRGVPETSVFTRVQTALFRPTRLTPVIVILLSFYPIDFVYSDPSYLGRIRGNGLQAIVQAPHCAGCVGLVSDAL